MTIVNVGVSHRIAPAELLEKLAVPSAELGGALAHLHAVPGIDEVVVLSTCNRVEVYTAGSRPAKQVTRAVADLMAARGRVRADEVLRLVPGGRGRGDRHPRSTPTAWPLPGAGTGSGTAAKATCHRPARSIVTR